MPFKRKRVKGNAYRVWGIRAPAIVRIRWIKLSGFSGVPCNRLILLILKYWLIENQEFFLNEEARMKLADTIS